MLKILNTTSIIIQIGAFLEPKFPTSPYTSSIIVEPITNTHLEIKKKCRKREVECSCKFCDTQVIFINAAVSNKSGIGTMNLYNYGGVASSLSIVTDDVSKTRFGKSTKKTTVMPWNKKKHEHMKSYTHNFEHVPLISLASLIDSIPKQIEIEHLFLDIQGHDLSAIKSCSKHQLQRIKKITNECWKDGTQPFYKDIDNYFASWKYYMENNGFKLSQTKNAWGTSNIQELDATWVKI